MMETDEEQGASEEYQNARDAFDSLKVEDRVIFLLEATITTLGKAVEKAANKMADILSTISEMDAQSKNGAPNDEAPPADDLPVEDKPAAKKPAPKKPATKKTVAKKPAHKKPTAKKTTKKDDDDAK